MKLRRLTPRQRSTRLRRKGVKVPGDDYWQLIQAATGIAEDKIDLVTKAAGLRFVALNGVETEESLPHLNFGELIEALKKADEKLQSDKKTLEAVVSAQGREAKGKQLKDLMSRKWLAAHKQAMLDERERLHRVAVLDLAIAATATNSLSMKNTELGI